MRRTALLTFAILLVALSSATAAFASAPVTGREKTSRGTSTSTNWSGYAAYNTTFGDVKGNWTQPPVDCTGVRRNQVAISSFWAGLDGYFSRTVEQTGTDADCVGSSPLHFAWYEFYPANLVQLSSSTYPVQPGDSMHAEVSHVGQTATVTLQNLTRNWTFSTSSSSKFAFSSAEWIMEAPTKTLANFGTVNFTNASASGGGTTNGAISDFTNDAITLVARKNVARATPSALSSGGTAFSVQFNQP